MYIMLALMLGTLYLRMPYKADTIQDRISLLFFSALPPLAPSLPAHRSPLVCAFMVFMSVAVLPQCAPPVRPVPCAPPLTLRSSG